MTDDELVATFERCTLPRSDWTHRAHLRVAMRYLATCPRDEAARRMREGLRRYNAVRGAARGYHETITMAWLAIVERGLREHGPDGLVDKLADPSLLQKHYSGETLRSDEARHAWIPPDREAL